MQSYLTDRQSGSQERNVKAGTPKSDPLVGSFNDDSEQPLAPIASALISFRWLVREHSALHKMRNKLCLAILALQTDARDKKSSIMPS